MKRLQRAGLAGVMIAGMPALAAAQTGGQPSAGGTSGAGQATEATAQNTGDNQEIIVTAERQAMSIQRAPLAVTAFTGEDLAERGAVSFLDYAAGVPSLAFQSLGPGEQRILLRGVSDGVDTATRGSAQNTTGIYIDDMVVSNNDTAPDLNLFDVDRVEILKGPQGTLYGDGSVGGLIRIITNRANVTDFEALGEATVASISQGGEEFAVNGMVNVPLVEGRLALRLVGQYRHNDGFIDDIVRNIEDVNDLEQYGARASLRWEPTQSLSVTLSGLYQDMRAGSNNSYNILAGDLLKGTIFAEPYSTRFALANATVAWDVGWATLTSSTSYADYRHRNNVDGTDFLGTILVPLPFLSQQGDDSETVTQEFRLASSGEQRLSWLAGLYYFRVRESGFEDDRVDGLFDFFEAIGLPLEGTPFDIGRDIIFASSGVFRRREYAAFGELTYRLADWLSATAGLRYFNDRISEREDVGGVVTEAPPFERSQRTSDDGVVFRFRLASQVTDDILLYATAAQGYRVGGLNPLNPFTLNDPTFPDAFEPDTLWTYEFGWKTRLFDRMVTFNGALFYTDWNNIQIEVPFPGGFSAISNAGRATIKGVELELNVRPISIFEFGVAGSVIDAELRGSIEGDMTNADPLDDFIAVPGNNLTGVPRVQGSAYAALTVPLSGALEGGLRADLQHVGRTQRFYGETRRFLVASGVTNDPNYFSYGDYTLINLRASLRWPTLEIAAFINNLTNSRARLFRGQQSTSAPAGREDIYVAQPRTVGLTLRKRF